MTENSDNRDEQYRPTETMRITRADAEALARGELGVDDVFTTHRISRRGLLQGAGVLSLGALVGATGTTVADAQGSLGQSGSPLAAAFLASIDGPIVDAGDAVTELVNIRVAEDDEEIEVDDDTLVIRYVEGGDG